MKNFNWLVVLAALLNGTAFAATEKVVCHLRTSTMDTTLQSKAVSFSDKEIRFANLVADDFVFVVDRVERSDYYFGLPGSNEPPVKSIKHSLYSGNLLMAVYFVSERGYSYHNLIGGDVARAAEPALFSKLIAIHGLERAQEISPWMLSTEACEVLQ